MKTNKLQISGIMLVGIIVISTFFYAINVQPVVTGDPNSVIYYKLKNFDSYRELTDFLKNSYQHQYSNSWNFADISSIRMVDDMIMSESVGMNGDGKLVDYSQTNVQVTGVDEPDIVKTDGTYLYIVSGNKVIVVKAYPADDAEIECEITVNESYNICNIFISGDRLVIFAETYNYPIYKGPVVMETGIAVDSKIAPYWYSSPDTFIKIFDLSNIGNPELKKDIVVGGSFSSARLIDDYIYVVTTQYSYDITYYDENQTVVPGLRVNDDFIQIPLSDITYVDIPEKSNTFTNIVSVNIHNDSEDVHAEVFLLGNSHVLYVSRDNIYVTYSKQYYDYQMLEDIIDEILIPILPDRIISELDIVKTLSLSEYQKKTVTEWILQNYTNSMSEDEKLNLTREIIKMVERTIIHRISINDGDIEYEAQGNIPGTIANQFQMSEHDGYLRVSTTMEGWIVSSFISGRESQNNVYVLDMDLDIVGSLEGLAPGERIYATRFIGDKCYLVTFRQIDPFFVIDLSDPDEPEVLGELKIPGFSTYLHPYDETHIIGIGRNGSTVKISLFDVSNMSNPIELAKYEVRNNESDWYWTESSALYEHKAFLFDKEKNLLVLPIGSYSKQSAYVFDISVQSGIDLKGTIEHDMVTDGNESEEPYYYDYYYDYGNSIKRTLFIEDVLYTVSDNMVKMNSLEDLSEINSVELV